MNKGRKQLDGTREWGVASVNCVTGCSHDCRYCYQRHQAVDRFGQVAEGEWPTMRVREKDVRKKQPKFDGVVMFPSSHDITPEVQAPCFEVLANLLKAGNSVLVVTKPHSSVIRDLCEQFIDFKEQIEFRFTIGAENEDLLRYWEPNAPSFAERFECLEQAWKSGYKTSVSMEPMIDPDNVVGLVEKLIPFVTETIWIGMMNRVRSRVHIESPRDEMMVRRLEAAQTDEKIMAIYQTLKDNRQIRWKKSIQKIAGLDSAMG